MYIETWSFNGLLQIIETIHISTKAHIQIILLKVCLQAHA